MLHHAQHEMCVCSLQQYTQHRLRHSVNVQRIRIKINFTKQIVQEIASLSLFLSVGLCFKSTCNHICSQHSKFKPIQALTLMDTNSSENIIFEWNVPISNRLNLVANCFQFNFVSTYFVYGFFLLQRDNLFYGFIDRQNWSKYQRISVISLRYIILYIKSTNFLRKYVRRCSLWGTAVPSSRLNDIPQ